MSNKPCKKLLSKYHACLNDMSDKSPYCGGIRRVYNMCDLLCSSQSLNQKHCDRYLATVVKSEISTKHDLSSTEKIS